MYEEYDSTLFDLRFLPPSVAFLGCLAAFFPTAGVFAILLSEEVFRLEWTSSGELLPPTNLMID